MNSVKRLTHKWILHSMADEECLVRDPSRMRRLRVREGIYFLLALVAINVATLNLGVWSILGIIVATILATQGAMAHRQRANSYRAGWIDGRHTVVASMLEASKRGMTSDDWVHGEIAREAAVLGISEDELLRGGKRNRDA